MTERPLTQEELVEFTLQLEDGITIQKATIGNAIVRVLFHTTVSRHRRLGFPLQLNLSGRKWVTDGIPGWYGIKDTTVRRCQAKYIRRDLT